MTGLFTGFVGLVMAAAIWLLVAHSLLAALGG